MTAGVTPSIVALALAATVSGGLPPVTVHGSIGQLVRQRDTAPKVALAEVLRTPHTFGLGSLSDLRGEITIVDGTAWLSYPPAAPGLGGVDLPFRIDGHFTTLTLAITDGRKVPPGQTSEEVLKKANSLQTEADVNATLVGFLAAKPDERFTHAGTRVHVHAVINGRRMTGHARAFKATAGVKLWLPAGS